MSFYRTATKYLLFSSLLASFAAFTFVLIAVIGPAWVIYDGTSSEWTLQEGIWMASFCEFDTGRHCLVSSREEIAKHMDNKQFRFDKELDESMLQESELLTTLSLIASFVCLSLVFAVVVLKTLKRNRQFSVFVAIAIVSSTVSWTVLLVPVIKVSHINRRTATSCWSWGLAVIGNVIQVFTSSFLFLAIVSDYVRTQLLNQRRAYRNKCFTIAMAYFGNYSGGERDLRIKHNFQHETANKKKPIRNLQARSSVKPSLLGHKDSLLPCPVVPDPIPVLVKRPVWEPENIFLKENLYQQRLDSAVLLQIYQSTQK